MLFLFSLLHLQSEGDLAVYVPRSTRDDELVSHIGRGPGWNGFVVDAATFEDGAGWQGAAGGVPS